MPRTASLNNAIATLVAAEVNAALAPYKNILDRVANVFGETPVRRGPGRPRKNAALAVAAVKPARRRARRGSRAKAALRAAGKFTEGQKVKFNVGRGVHEGKVVKIDAKKGVLTLERTKDGKRIVRPAAKVKRGGGLVRKGVV